MTPIESVNNMNRIRVQQMRNEGTYWPDLHTDFFELYEAANKKEQFDQLLQYCDQQINLCAEKEFLTMFEEWKSIVKMAMDAIFLPKPLT
jgi:hypothetical protein